MTARATTIDTRSVSLRHLKAAVRVADFNNVTRAARSLGRSQTAVTKALSDLERQLGVRLFNRSSTGVVPTAYGDALVRRARTVAEEFYKAGRAYLRFIEEPRHIETNPVFAMDISLKRFAAFIALFDHAHVDRAAAALELSPSAIYSSVREIENHLALDLFERSPAGVTPTEYARILATHVKLAVAEILYVFDDIASLQGVTRGRVAIGTLPFTRTIIVPRAINRLLAEHPQIQITARDGAYGVLETALRSGNLDFIVGALRPRAQVTDLDTEPLFKDCLSVIARPGHPLADRDSLSFDDLRQQQWILPPPNTPARRVFEATLTAKGIEAITPCIETSSLAMVRGLLMESDRVALLSEHQIHIEEMNGLLIVLPFDLKETYRPIGVTMRARATLSPAAQLFLEHLRDVSREMMTSAQE